VLFRANCARIFAKVITMTQAMLKSPKQKTDRNQLELLPSSKETLPSNGHSAFNDPAFASNKTVPIHRWVPWIAGFSSDFVQGVMRDFFAHKKKGVVLDPFAGVGTTLIEAVLSGHNALGFEINPYAALACKVKLESHQVDLDEFAHAIKAFDSFYKHCVGNGYIPKTKPPEKFRTQVEFYSPRVLRKVLVINDFIADIKSESIRDLFRIAFAATMVQYSNYSYEPSLGKRVSSGKAEIEDYPVETAIEAKLINMLEDIKWIKEKLPSKAVKFKVYSDSFLKRNESVKAESVDLIITSPPYLNNYHYSRNTRPQLYWLDIFKERNDLRIMEEYSFGKFWQTVRDQEAIDLEFKLKDRSLERTLNQLRHTNTEKGVYGGHGWANYAATYFNDCHKFALRIKSVLRRGGKAFVVLGNSIIQGIPIATDKYFGEICENAGLKLDQIDIPRLTRNGNSIINSSVRSANAGKSARLYEAIVVVSKR